MSVLKTVASAGVALLIGLSSASAAVSAPGQPPRVPAGDLIQVQGRSEAGPDRRGPDGRGPDRGGRDFRPGGRYERAPSHWHRYHRRPHDWHRRGCIIVGPVWFCP
jgi:hypothetical protein